MTNTEKIITSTKNYILNVYLEGYSTHKNMVLGLKNGIDYFVGREEGIDTIKDQILETCLAEFDERTKVFDKVGHLKMVDEIRNNFIEFIKVLDANELSEISPIPYERRLTIKESKRLEISLKEKFDFGSWKDENYYWEPLSKTQNNLPTIYFKDNLIDSERTKKLIDLIKKISGDRIYLTTDENLCYEVEVSSLNFDWIESAYCDLKTNWLIYVSHEGTITFEGEDLKKGIEKQLPEIMTYKNPWE